LLEQGKTLRYFGTMIEAGSHQRSLQLVMEGQADAAAIDSHVLDALLWHNKDLELQLRVIARLGPSSIPPVVVARSLDSNLKCRLQEALITMHDDPIASNELHKGRIDHFATVTDADYNDIRTIFAQVQAAMKA
jgi:phosphonate transport system substrate-binding protein